MTPDRSHSDTVGRVANKVRVEGGEAPFNPSTFRNIALLTHFLCPRDFSSLPLGGVLFGFSYKNSHSKMALGNLRTASTLILREVSQNRPPDYIRPQTLIFARTCLHFGVINGNAEQEFPASECKIVYNRLRIITPEN